MGKKHEYLFCEICKIKTNCGCTTFGRWHLQKYHPEYDIKKYYDEFIKKNKEGMCKTCSGETTYFSFNVGYLEYCSTSCVANGISIKERIKKTKIEKYGSLNNYNKIKETLLMKYGVDNVSKLSTIKEKKKITLKKHYGVESVLESNFIKNKIKKTLMSKYGVDNPSKLDWVVDKKRKTMLAKYGSDNFSKTRLYREYQEQMGRWISESDKSNFELYFKNVWKITKKHKKRLFSNWNGRCYYNDSLLDKNLPFSHPLYPVIDHKTSVYYGFKNQIDPNIIGNFDNLCICSRKINSKKGIMNEEEFKLKNVC